MAQIVSSKALIREMDLPQLIEAWHDEKYTIEEYVLIEKQYQQMTGKYITPSVLIAHHDQQTNSVIVNKG